MKFLASALLALVYGAQANKFSADELNDMVTNGMIDKERLLRNSVPAPRKLQNNYQYGNNNQGNSQYNQYSGYNGNNRYNGNNNQNVSVTDHSISCREDGQEIQSAYDIASSNAFRTLTLTAPTVVATRTTRRTTIIKAERTKILNNLTTSFTGTTTLPMMNMAMRNLCTTPVPPTTTTTMNKTTTCHTTEIVSTHINHRWIRRTSPHSQSQTL